MCFPDIIFLVHVCLNTQMESLWDWRLTVYEISKQLEFILQKNELLHFNKPVDYVLEILFESGQMTQCLKRDTWRQKITPINA